MKNPLLILVLSLLSTSAFSQQYKTAIGIKGDWSTLNSNLAQVSVKHFFQAPNAVEVNFSAGRHFIWLEGLYLYNQPLKNNFDWYAGGGIDLGYWGEQSADRLEPQQHLGFWGGMTGVFGIEHTFDFIPINIALDAGPSVRIVPNFEVGLKVGFAARYAFGSR